MGRRLGSSSKALVSKRGLPLEGEPTATGEQRFPTRVLRWGSSLWSRRLAKAVKSSSDSEVAHAWEAENMT